MLKAQSSSNSGRWRRSGGRGLRAGAGGSRARGAHLRQVARPGRAPGQPAHPLVGCCGRWARCGRAARSRRHRLLGQHGEVPGFRRTVPSGRLAGRMAARAGSRQPAAGTRRALLPAGARFTRPVPPPVVRHRCDLVVHGRRLAARRSRLATASRRRCRHLCIRAAFRHDLRRRAAGLAAGAGCAAAESAPQRLGPPRRRHRDAACWTFMGTADEADQGPPGH